MQIIRNEYLFVVLADIARAAGVSFSSLQAAANRLCRPDQLKKLAVSVNTKNRVRVEYRLCVLTTMVQDILFEHHTVSASQRAFVAEVLDHAVAQFEKDEKATRAKADRELDAVMEEAMEEAKRKKHAAPVAQQPNVKVTTVPVLDDLHAHLTSLYRALVSGSVRDVNWDGKTLHVNMDTLITVTEEKP